MKTRFWILLLGACLVGSPGFAQEKPTPPVQEEPEADEEPPTMPDVKEEDPKTDPHHHHHHHHDAKDHPNTRKDIFGAFSEVTKKAGNATVRILSKDKPVALATVVDTEGYLLSKASELRGGELTCRTASGDSCKAELIATNPDYDLALLKVDVAGLTPVSWRNRELPAQGFWLVAQSEKGEVLSVGVVGTDPRVVPGRRRSVQSRGFLGVQLHNTSAGVRIRSVLPDTAAEKAELKSGDLLSGVNGEIFSTTEKMINYIGRHREGDTLAFSVTRGDEGMEVEVDLGGVPSRVRDTEKQKDRWGGGPFSDRRQDFPAVIPHDVLVDVKDCGGPLFDIRGRCVGIQIARALRVSNYAVTAEDAQRIVEELKGSAKAE